LHQSQAIRDRPTQQCRRYHAEVGEIEAEAESIAGEVQAVDLEDESAAQRRLVTLYVSRLNPLRARVEQMTQLDAMGREGPDIQLPDRAIPAQASQVRSTKLD
jgi:hypothetical protein